MGSSGFIPIRLEIGGNIAKINAKIASNSKRFDNLLFMVKEEVSEGLAHHPNSASNALMWLIKYLMFIHCFLTISTEGSSTSDTMEEVFIKNCLAKAYETVLRRYHNSVIHNVFSVSFGLCLGFTVILITLIKQALNSRSHFKRHRLGLYS